MVQSMRLGLIGLFLVIWTAVSIGDTQETTEKQPVAFPTAWEGVWKGPCRAFSPGGKSHTFAMELRIRPLEESDSRTWTMVYGEGEQQQVREYELQTIDAAKGEFAIDEKNSIVIPAYLLGDRLVSRYEVGGHLMSVTYTLAGDSLRFDILSGGNETSETGGEGEIPVVSVYPLSVVQRAELKKQ